MKISYELTKKDLSKYLIKGRFKNNVFLFIIFTLVYFYLRKDNINNNFSNILLWYGILIICFIIFIFILDRIYTKLYIFVGDKLNNKSYGKYTISLDNKKFSISIDSKKIDYKYNMVKKIKEKKNCFYVITNSRKDSFIFEKNFFKNEEEYNKFLNYFKEKTN